MNIDGKKNSLELPRRDLRGLHEARTGDIPFEQPSVGFITLKDKIETSSDVSSVDLEDALVSKDPNIKINELECFALMRMLLKRTEAEREMFKGQAILDGLTGVLNRRGLDQELNEVKERLKHTKEGVEKRKSHPGHVLFFIVDVNDFKKINDTYGHDKGDEALKLVASCLKEEAIERGGKAARVGGDEFAILEESSVGCTTTEAQVISSRIEEKINSLLFVLDDDGKEVRFTVSIGGAVLNSGEDRTIDQLKKEADTAMYKRKSR